MPQESPTRPFVPHMERLRHEFERWLEAAWTQGGRAIDAIGLRGRHHQPAIDMIEHADSVEIAFDLPGVDCSEIELTVSGHSLTLSGEYPKTDVPNGSRMQLSERPQGEFCRTIMLPPGLDGAVLELVHLQLVGDHPEAGLPGRAGPEGDSADHDGADAGHGVTPR